jgi:NAD dependent epimerase/dehydratase family enzyme
MSWISLEDTVAAILFALETPWLAGAVNVVSPNPVRNAEFTRALARHVHRPAVLPVPAFALRLALGQMADEALLASARVIPAKLLSAGFKFAYPTLDGALAAALS